MKILTIERAKWRRGGNGPATETQGLTALLNHEGYMCCLGFDALACGVPTEAIMCRIDPTCVDIRLAPLAYLDSRTRGAYKENASAVKTAIDANDNPYLRDAEREVQVREALLVFWDDVVFV